MRNFLGSSGVWLCLLGLAFAAAGCASSDAEDVQRRYQLLQLENGNLAHDRDSVAQDLKNAKRDQAALEDKAANLRQALDAEHRNNDSIRDELTLAQGKVADLTAKQEQLRALITSTTVPDKQLRTELLKVLGPAPGTPGAAGPGLPPTTLPAAPAPTASTSHH